MSKKIADLLDEIQVKGNLTLEEIGEKIKRSRPYLSTEKKKEEHNKKLELLLRETFKDLLKKETVTYDNGLEYLIKKATRNDAMLRVVLMALAELLAAQRNESVIKVLSELTRAVTEETDRDK